MSNFFWNSISEPGIFSSSKTLTLPDGKSTTSILTTVRTQLLCRHQAFLFTFTSHFLITSDVIRQPSENAVNATKSASRLNLFDYKKKTDDEIKFSQLWCQHNEMLFFTHRDASLWYSEARSTKKLSLNEIRPDATAVKKFIIQCFTNIFFFKPTQKLKIQLFLHTFPCRSLK